MKYSSKQLVDYIQTEHTIDCGYCRHSDYTMDGTDEYASEVFFQMGWRSTNKNTYCPKCAKKKLKQETDGK